MGLSLVTEMTTNAGKTLPAQKFHFSHGFLDSTPCRHVIVKYCVIAFECPPGAIRWPAGPADGSDPQTTNRYQGYPYRYNHSPVSGVHGPGARDGYQSGIGIRSHGGD